MSRQFLKMLYRNYFILNELNIKLCFGINVGRKSPENAISLDRESSDNDGLKLWWVHGKNLQRYSRYPAKLLRNITWYFRQNFSITPWNKLWQPSPRLFPALITFILAPNPMINSVDIISSNAKTTNEIKHVFWSTILGKELFS